MKPSFGELAAMFFSPHLIPISIMLWRFFGQFFLYLGGFGIYLINWMCNCTTLGWRPRRVSRMTFSVAKSASVNCPLFPYISGAADVGLSQKRRRPIGVRLLPGFSLIKIVSFGYSLLFLFSFVIVLLKLLIASGFHDIKTTFL